MMWLSGFTLPTASEEESFLFNCPRAKMTVYSGFYPFGLFRERGFTTFSFSEITVFYGDNGSGKSTILNLIAEKLRLNRRTPFNRTDFFGDFVRFCHEDLTGRIPTGSAILTSDDVFDSIMDVRRKNDRIDEDREVLGREYQDENAAMHSGVPNRLEGLSDVDRWREASAMRRKTRSAFLRERVPLNLPERSNGESALAFFAETIGDNKLYLLDEPENSLSPVNQRLLAGLIDDAAHHRGCQFILSTHSPFLLSLRGARVWNLDAIPPAVTDWTKLENVRVYRDFFKDNEHFFIQ